MNPHTVTCPVHPISLDLPVPPATPGELALRACERFVRAMEFARHPDPRLDARLPARMLAEAEVLAREAIDAAKGITG